MLVQWFLKLEKTDFSFENKAYYGNITYTGNGNII